MHTTTGLAALLALAAVTADGIGAESAARRLLDAGVQPPRWAGAIGSPDLLDCWSTTDAFGDQTAYYFGFRYAGQSGHLTMALVDRNLGGIVKDAVNAPLKDDRPLAEMLNTDPDVPLEATEPAAAAATVLAALATGDQFIDNYWTDDFKDNRALLLARMRSVAGVAQVAPPIPEPPDIREQERLTQDFMASDLAPPGDETLPIVDQCVISRCNFGDGDPLRWSPTVVEMFLLDYLPRKASLSFAEIAAVPAVLKAWVRFALTRRGLQERYIAETEAAVDRFTPEFRKAMTDQSSFGPAKSLVQAMRVDGVDILDAEAVQAWMDEFNARPEEQREELLGRSFEGLD